ncbi:TSG10 protein, partial [Ceuthmochares aereus]|nr:TSG10 protein [Ceuthmochares aereus]
IEDLKKINHELWQCVVRLLDKKQVTGSQVDRFTGKNYRLHKELAATGKLSEELRKKLQLNTADKELEEAKSSSCPCTGRPQHLPHVSEADVPMLLEYCQGWCHDCFPGEPVPVLHHPLSEHPFPNIQHNPPLAHLPAGILQTEAEIKQGKSPLRLDTFIKSLEKDKDYYKSATENLLKAFRNTFASPNSDPEILKLWREREELKSTLKKSERHMSEIQGNFKVLTAERDKIVKIFQLRQELIKCCRTPKSTVTAQAILKHVEIERDTALLDFRRMATERDSLREQLKISQEIAFNEKAHSEQRIEELETTIQNLDSERLEQMTKAALMKDTIDSLETEMKRLARTALDSKTEQSRQEAEYRSLSLLKEKTEQSLSEAQQSLAEKNYEIRLTQKKIKLLDEKIDNFSRQSFVQQEEICSLKEAIAQLDKEKASLQDRLEEGREKITTFEGSLEVKEKTISDFRILISELERSTKKSAEALCTREKDIANLHKQVQNANKELAQANKDRESLAQENGRLQEHLSNIKQENQALHQKLAKYQHELDDMKLKAQDLNTDIASLKGALNSKERENCELLKNYHRAREHGESWEAKWHQAEEDCSSVRLALITVESENRTLKEKIESLETEVKQVILPEFTGDSSMTDSNSAFTLHLHVRIHFIAKIKRALSENGTGPMAELQSECESSHSEIELLRKQRENERASKKSLESLFVSSHEREFKSQLTKQEKDSEIQFLKEQFSLAENKLAAQSRDLTQLRNRAAQIESELDLTKRQLGTERFERQVYGFLRHQSCTVSYQLSSTLRSLSPERSHHEPPDW